MNPMKALFKVVTTRSGWFYLWARDYAEAGTKAEEHMKKEAEEMRKTGCHTGADDSEIKSITTVVHAQAHVINERV